MPTALAKTDEARVVYVLPTNESEQSRLNGQHIYMKIVTYESRLIYDEAVHLEAGNQVLDVGTGTGIWLMDLTKHLPPSVELFGCDISSGNFPKECPENVHFSISSVTDLPNEWAGKFNFVHQRLLFGALTSSGWHDALSEIYRVTKPGGHIQLIEMDMSSTINAGPATKRMLKYAMQLLSKRGLLFDCSRRLPRLLEAAGFVDIASDKKCLPAGQAWGRIGQLGQANFVAVCHNMAPAMKATGIVDEESVVYELIEECAEEWDGAEEGIQFMSHIVCARRPIDK